MTATLIAPSPVLTLNDVLPARPLDGSSRKPREATARASELGRQIRAEKAEHVNANHERTADLVELITAGKPTTKVLAAITASTLRILELDIQIAALNVATGRLTRIHSEALKHDDKINGWAREVRRIRTRWNQIDHEAADAFPIDAKHAIKVSNKGQIYRPAEYRAEFLTEERATLADAVARGRYRQS
jgi:hypothetical protein